MDGPREIVVGEVRQRQTLYDITYRENLKNNTHEFTYKIQTDSQTQKASSWLLRSNGAGTNPCAFQALL